MSTVDEAKKELATATITPKTEALIEAMYIAANADDDFGAKEREHFVRNVVGIGGGAIKPEDVKAVLLKLKGKAKEGRASRLKTLGPRLPRPQDKEHAFALACSMALADGIVLDEEKQFVDELAQSLGISQERADTILDELKALEPDEE
jgi:tellurite resistance protein